MSTSHTPPKEQRQINNIALTLGVEPPYVSTQYEGRQGAIIGLALDGRKWQNFLDTVERVAEQHGRIQLQETIGQQSFDLGA